MPDLARDGALYDSILLGTARSPGVVTVSAHDRAYKWDVKEGNGQEGASSTLKGSTLANPVCSFYLADDDERAEWETFERIIAGMVEGQEATALTIYHPDLASKKIDAVSCAKIGGMVHDGKGGSTVAVTFQEYKPKKKKSSSPSGAKTSAGGGANDPAKPPDPNAAAKAQLEALRKEAAAP